MAPRVIFARDVAIFLRITRSRNQGGAIEKNHSYHDDKEKNKIISQKGKKNQMSHRPDAKNVKTGM